MAKTFLQEFTEACERLEQKNPYLKTETDRIHQDAVRDPNHAFRKVDIVKPDPWKHGSGLTI